MGSELEIRGLVELQPPLVDQALECEEELGDVHLIVEPSRASLGSHLELDGEGP